MNMVILENAQHLWGPTCVGPVVESEQQFFGTARTVLLQFIGRGNTGLGFVGNEKILIVHV